MTTYEKLKDEQVMRLACELDERRRCQDFSKMVLATRELLDGKDRLHIPESHKGLKVGENHEGSHRLNVRIKQGAGWLGKANILFSVTPGGTEERDAARAMERFARWGEKKLAQGTPLHRWRQEVNRDIFESGVGIMQQNPRREFYVSAQDDPNKLVKGARLNEVMWRRRVDPATFRWAEGDDGGMPAGMIVGDREVGALSRILTADGYANLAQMKAKTRGFDWVESLNEPLYVGGKDNVATRELWVGDRGYLIVWADESAQLKKEDPIRIVSSWRNFTGKPPFYMVAGSWPWVSPLDEMIQLTNERNYWATMLDLQAAGAIFRHWQLIQDTTGDPISASLYSQPVPENVLLDLTQPPPDMGPGTRWEIAPYEFHDVLPRYQQIVAQHEAAGSAVARLMGQDVGAYTAVGTVDMMEEFADREFADITGGDEGEGGVAQMLADAWQDTFKYLRVHHPEKVIVSGRVRDTTEEGEGRFFNSTLELTGKDIVSEDISVRLDTRSALRKAADYRMGREMQNNGDMSFPRRVEEGLVPWVDDAEEEKADIFADTVENGILEQKAMEAIQQQGQQANAEPPPRPSITTGGSFDRRGTGAGKGPSNISDSAMQPSSPDVATTRAA